MPCVSPKTCAPPQKSMANKSRTAKFKNPTGELTVQQHETDSPIIPVGQLERLQKFKPEAVDWVIEQTGIEADYRRKERHRLNKFVFIEKLIGQIFALLVGLAGISGGSFVALNGQPWAGGVLASLAITGLAVVFLIGKKEEFQRPAKKNRSRSSGFRSNAGF